MVDAHGEANIGQTDTDRFLRLAQRQGRRHEICILQAENRGQYQHDDNQDQTCLQSFRLDSLVKPTSSNSKGKVEKMSNCAACKDKHPLWRCQVFRKKTTTERAKLVADNRLCFSWFNANHSFRQCPQPCKCTKDARGSSHNTLLHGAERIFTKNTVSSNKAKPASSGCIGTMTNSE